MRKNILFLFLILIVTVLAALFVLPEPNASILGKINVPNFRLNNYLPWRLGLDLVGGTALVYEINLEGIDYNEHQDVVDSLRNVIENRINIYGVTEPRIFTVRKEEHHHLIIELAGVRDFDEAIQQIGKTPVLEFRDNCQILNVDAENNIDVENNENQEELETVTIVCQKTALSGRHISRATVDRDQLNRFVVSFELTNEGSEIFEELTANNIDKPLCIFIDNDLVFPNDFSASCPLVQEKITGGRAQISGGGITSTVASEMVSRFNAGALSAPIRLITQRNISASAAAEWFDKMIFAGIIGVLLIAVFLTLYYRSFGVIASLALIIYVILTLAVFKLIPNFVMSLAGLAGFILSIGMATDASVLIFERIKEEIKNGASKLEAFENGFSRAWSSIRDSNISTILTAIILYYLTSSFVRGFALTLMIGVIVSMFSAIIITKNILKVFIFKK